MNRSFAFDERLGSILSLVRDHVASNRSQIAGLLHISKSTAERAVKWLVDAGLLLEEGSEIVRVGRGGIDLALHPQGPCAIGIDLGASHLALGAFTLGGETLHATSVPIQSDMTRDAILALMDGELEALLATLCREGRQVLGVGFGDPGVIDAKQGMSLKAVNLPHWCNVPVVEHIAHGHAVPVRLQGSARVKCLAEVRYGAARGAKGFLFIDLGVGIGLGVYSQGRLYEGEQGRGCELGHMVVLPEGALCSCGGRGCLEAVASGVAMLRQAREALRQGVGSLLSSMEESRPADAGEVPPIRALTMEHLIHASAERDRLATGILESAASILGTAVGNLCNLFNPELVVFGGGLARTDALLAVMETAIRRSALPSIHEQLRVARSCLEDTAGALGAAELIFQEFVAAPMAWLKNRFPDPHLPVG